MATKRKHSSKPMHEKYQALLEVENGGKKKDIAEKYGVPLNVVKFQTCCTMNSWVIAIIK